MITSCQKREKSYQIFFIVIKFIDLRYKGCPTRLYDTLSSFSNQDEGGVIIFGVDENDKYKIKGVYDPQDLQKKITEQCKQMEPIVRALFTVCDIEDKVVVSAEIPGVDITERPVFYKGVGRIKGSYIRVGESDEPMSEYEVYSYEAFRKRIRDDIRTVDEAKLQLLDENRLNDYLTMVKQERRNLSENVSNEEILELMAVTASNVPTLAGVMTFSKYPQTYFPQLCITAVCLPGTEMGAVGESGERFIDNKRITGAIPDMLEEAVEFVRKNSRTKTIIDDNGKISIDVLGKVHPETRNAALANMLELLKITENRYFGISTMRSEFIQAGLPVPIFSVVHGEFKVVMKNDCYKENATSEQAILDFCSIPRSRAELIGFTGKSCTYTMISLVAPLVSAGKLKMTLPDKPKSSKQRYIKA